MQRRIIDQGESEALYHRVLYGVVFIRASLLNTVVLFLAVAIYSVTGSGLGHPGMRELRHFYDILHTQQGAGPTAFLLFAALFAVFFLVNFTLFIGLARVWKSMLLVLSICFGLLSVFVVLGGLVRLAFSLDHFVALMSFVIVLFIAIYAYLFVDLAIAYWRVARAKERSTFRAIFDARLCRGLPGYFHRLFDLPRTPFRTVRTAVSYLLAVGGEILLVVAFLYLLGFAGLDAKYRLLEIICNGSDPDRCETMSYGFALVILIGCVLALLGVWLGSAMQALSKRIGGLALDDAIGVGSAFVLYLRPFDVDSVVLPRPKLPILSRVLAFRTFPYRIEDELFDVADGHRPLVAIANPSGPGQGKGGQAYRAALDDSEWQAYVADLIYRAESIVMVLKETEGVIWEVATVLSADAADKTLFLFDPEAKSPERWDEIAATIQARFEECGVLPGGFELTKGILGFYFRAGELIEIRNRNFSATSYRTAFSEFLGERAGG